MKIKLFKLIISFLIVVLSGSFVAGQDNPASFNATPQSPVLNELSFTLNAASDDVLIAFSTNNIFGNPTGTYINGDPIVGGGTVIYYGDISTQDHVGLTANTKYYYKIWSYDGIAYSSGLLDSTTTYKWEPSYHPTIFLVSSKTHETITLTWKDAVGVVKPDAYLIKASTVGLSDISNPIDGIEESPSTLVKVVNYGVQTVTFSGLTGNTDYYFKIYSYTNSGSHIDYKTTAPVQNATAKTDITPALITVSGTASEENEAGQIISVDLSNDDFVATLTPSNWIVNYLPLGVTVGSIIRSSSTSVSIELSGNRTKDYDTDITNVEVVIAGAELVLNSDSISANSGFTFTADADAESLSLSYDGSINEGAENGEIILVNLSGGTFVSSINAANWSVVNLPLGVNATNFTKNSSTQIQFTLSGNATSDYDVDISNLKVECTASEVDDHSGSNLSVATGVIFTATDDSEVLTLSYSGGVISEGSEDAIVVNATISGGTFSNSLSPTNWQLIPKPEGVNITNLYRSNSTEVEITLTGNRTKDYDSDILSSIKILASEFADAGITTDLVSTNQITFDALDDAELVSMADDGSIAEGAEDGEIITVSLAGGTFADPITSSNWVLSNLPAGVSKGLVERINSTTVQITLSGNATVDYESNITNLALTINEDEIDDYSSGDYLINTGVTFTASDDEESIALSWAASPGTNGAEATLDNEVIIIELTGGTFVSSEINTSNILMNGSGVTDAGISIESVSYLNPTQIELELAWNATDFDVDKYLRVSVAAIAYDLSHVDSLSINASIILTATVEPATLVLSDNTIVEGDESLGEIYVTLTNDLFKIVNSDEPNDPTNWELSNLPLGVTKGVISVTSTTTATISLVGSRTNDYDSDIINTTLNIDADEFVSSNNAASANTGVVFVATDDNEIITIGQASAINEGAEDGKIITLSLAGGNWAASLTPANFTLNNASSGVSVGAVSIDGVDDSKVNLTLSGNRTVDYDVDLTSMTVTVAASELFDVSAPVTSTAGSVIFTAIEETVLIAHAGLTETNLDGAIVSITLTNETFADGVLSSTNFTLSGAHNGLTVNSVIWTSASTASLELAFDGSDFDSDFENFYIIINSAELSGVGNLSSNELIITAINDAESFAISAGTINEGVENGKIITVTLTGGTFVNPLTASEWSLLNEPAGVSIGSVSRVSSTLASVTLSGNRTQDYDANLAVSVVANSSQIDDHSADITSDNSVVFTASDLAPESLTLVTKTIFEGAENNQVIEVLVNYGTFAATLNPSNWFISNLPDGVTAGAPVKTSPTSVTITLTGNRTVDYDSDITNFTVSVTEDEVDDYSGANLVISSGITFQASNDAESLSLSWGATPGTNGLEASMDDEVIVVTLSGGTFISSEINATNVTLSGSGVDDAGITLQSATYVNATTVNLALNWDGTDYDVDKYLRISVAQDAYSMADSVINKSIILPATDEPASIKIYNSVVVNEASEDGNVIRVQLFDDVFESSLTPSSWTINNLPNGISVGTITRIGDTVATIGLVGNRTVDYDADIADIEVIVGGGEFQIHSNDASAQSGFVLTANNDNEVISISGFAAEGNEDVDSVVVMLAGGNWATLDKNNWTLDGAPAGVAIESLSIDGSDPLKVHLLLSGNRSADYDANITNMTITVLASELDDVASGTVTSLTGFTFVATDESATISHAGLTELNLNNATISLVLSNESFVDFSNLVPGDFILNNAPSGVSVFSVTGVSATDVSIVLAYDETDFDVDYTHFSVTVDANVVLSNGDITSNELTISYDNTEPAEEILVSWSNPPATNGAEASLDNDKILISISNGDFIVGQINTTNITASGTAVTDAGVSIESVNYLSANTVEVSLAWDGTDFDVDKTLVITVSGNAYTEGTDPLSDEIDIIANVESLNTSVSTLTYFGNVLVGDNSAEQSFSVSGTSLLSDVTVTPPADFEISETSGSGFTTSPIVLTPVSGTLSATTIYVRFSPLSAGSKSATILVESNNVASKTVAVSGYGINSGATGNVVITEVADYYYDSNNDYIEIYNNGTAAVDLTGWTITQRTTTDNTTEIEFEFDALFQENSGGSNYMILEPGEYAVVVRANYAALISNHSIPADVAVFSDGSFPLIDNNDRFQLSSTAKAIEDNFGDWDDYSTFSTESSNSYERIVLSADGEVEPTWSSTASTSYDYTPGTDNVNPLPIRLIDFNVAKHDDNLLVKWITASELNSYYFQIEESVDGLNFFAIGVQNAAGFSNSILEYSFSTNLPNTPKTYYRLVSFDYDGSLVYSKIATLNLNNILNIGQPYFNGYQIVVPISQFIDKPINFELLDINGRLIHAESVSGSNNMFKFKALDLVSGVYIIRINSEEMIDLKKIIIP